jgi:hypothetical protein
LNPSTIDKNRKIAGFLKTRILPKVIEHQQKELREWPHETSSANEDILQAGIEFLRGENLHLSGFIAGSTYRWQGVEFVIWLKEVLGAHVDEYPPLTAKEVLECLTPFLIALLHHEDMPQVID